MPARAALDDLDELLARCRGSAPRPQLAEAIACHRAGSPRGCVLHTWAAVAADLLAKLRLLAASGPAELRASLAGQPALASADDGASAMASERALLALAGADAELLTPHEHHALGLLLADRDAALHPDRDSEAPDLDHAGTHLRTAVDLVLARHPVQGRHALAGLWSELESAYFPADVDAAVAYLRAGPMASVRPAVVRDAAAELVRRAVEELHPAATRAGLHAALAALARMAPTPVSETLSRVLPACAAAVADDGFGQLLALFAAVPGSLALAGEAARAKVAAYTARTAATAATSPAAP